MKIMTGMLAAATATMTAPLVPAQAAGEPLYTATHRPRHNIYCVKNNPKVPASGEQRIVGRACHTERQWRRWGLTFSRRHPAAKVALRD